MKKILIVIHDMRIGGAQKSLLSFLECLEGHEKRGEYEIHLLPLKPEGEFLSQLPASVMLEKPGHALCWMSMPLSPKLLKDHFSLRGVLGEGLWLIRKALKCFPKGLNATQKLWKNWRRIIPAHREAYDVAVAYMDGTSSYYVMDKVQAEKKVLWLHNDYEKLRYAPAFDVPYYQACDKLITISDECRDAVVRAHPTAAEKVQVLPNMTSSQAVQVQSRMGECPEYADDCGLKLLTVGRLNEQKGIDLAIQAAAMLRDAGERFVWLVLGEGAQRSKLERMIQEADLGAYFRLLGARTNPYVYMRRCDILVQSSRYEGKSIVLDEVKLLDKPIVATDYSTVHDALVHGSTGWIVDMTPAGIASGIMTVAGDAALRQRLATNLAALPKGNTDEVQRYIDLMF